MNLDSEGLIDLDMGGQGPLCPNSLPPAHPAHQLAVTFQNAAYRATPRDADGEPTTPELAAVNMAVSYGEDTNDRMSLYRDVVIARTDGYRTAAVEALFFRCLLCGLILPASRVLGRS